MGNLSIQEQIEVLKNNCEVQVAAATYKQSENISIIQSQIKGLSSEKEYCEKRIIIYESLKSGNSNLSNDLLDTIAELKERVSNLNVRIGGLEENLKKEQIKYQKAYKIALEKAEKKYRCEVQKVMKSSAKEDEAASE